jgi:hypothetical protein
MASNDGRQSLLSVRDICIVEVGCYLFEIQTIYSNQYCLGIQRCHMSQYFNEAQNQNAKKNWNVCLFL